MKKTPPKQESAAPAPEVPMFPDSPDVLNLDEASALLQISTKTFRGLLASGAVKCFKIGRIYKVPKTALIAYVKANTDRLPT